MEDFKTIADELIKSKDPNAINILTQKIAKLEYGARRIKIGLDGLKDHLARDKIQYEKVVATINKEIVQAAADEAMYLEAVAYGKKLLKIRTDGKKKAVK